MPIARIYDEREGSGGEQTNVMQQCNHNEGSEGKAFENQPLEMFYKDTANVKPDVQHPAPRSSQHYDVVDESAKFLGRMHLASLTTISINRSIVALFNALMVP